MKQSHLLVPPVYFGVALALMGFFNAAAPLAHLIDAPYRYAGAVIAALALALIVWAALLFRRAGTHIAVVLDEYGGASGIVSMENITEELFGQIQDEFDRERPEVEPLGNGRYRVRGDYLIEDLAGRLKVDVGDPAEETIGGYVASTIGREVAAGDKVELGELEVEVIEGERYRVRWVLVTRKTPLETEALEQYM